MYMTDKNKNIKNPNVNYKKTYTIYIPLTKPTRAIVWYPFPYRSFKTIKGLGMFYFYRNNILYFWF